MAFLIQCRMKNRLYQLPRWFLGEFTVLARCLALTPKEWNRKELTYKLDEIMFIGPVSLFNTTLRKRSLFANKSTCIGENVGRWCNKEIHDCLVCLQGQKPLLSSYSILSLRLGYILITTTLQGPLKSSTLQPVGLMLLKTARQGERVMSRWWVLCCLGTE